MRLVLLLFLGLAPFVSPAAIVFEDAGDSISRRAAALAERVAALGDSGQSAPELHEQAAELGGAAVLACAELLREGAAGRNSLLHAVMASASGGRAWPAEILRHYDPVAWRLFHHGEGRREQERIAGCLRWRVWAPATPEVLVRAAPVPTLEWLGRQALAPAPELERLQLVWKAWGLWVRSGRELQHVGAVRERIAALAGNPAIVGDTPSCAALAKFAGESGAVGALPFLINSLRAGATGEIRGNAAIALGRCGGPGALTALAAQAERENDAGVLVKLASALETWPEETTAGAALEALFVRVPDAAVRRSVMFAAIAARWPQRPALVLRALAVDAGGVAGVALQAVTARSEPGAREAVMSLAVATRSAQPALVDALGALRDARAGEILSRWALAEANPSLLIKLVHALRGVGGAEARAALTRLLKNSLDGLVVEHVILALEELAVGEAVPQLLAFAADRTAPSGVRLQAIRALGAFRRDDVREGLGRLADRVAAEFGGAEEGASARSSREERIEQARVYLAVARMRMGVVEGAAEVGNVFAQGTATARFVMLQLLGALRIEHPVIREGLSSSDFAVLLAAVNAARRIDPVRYRPELERLASSPFLEALNHSAIDAMNFGEILAEAIAEAGGAKAKPHGGHR